MRTLPLIAVVLAAVLTAACSSDRPRNTTPTSPPPAPAAASPASPAAQTTAPPGQARPLTVQGYTITATAYRWQQPLKAELKPDRAGFVFGGLEARVCVRETPGPPADISIDPWTIAYGDDTIVEPVTPSAEVLSVPLYPQFSRAVPVGECVRGWVVFEVPVGKRPVRAVYTPTGTDVPAVPLRWRLG